MGKGSAHLDLNLNFNSWVDNDGLEYVEQDIELEVMENPDDFLPQVLRQEPFDCIEKLVDSLTCKTNSNIINYDVGFSIIEDDSELDKTETILSDEISNNTVLVEESIKEDNRISDISEKGSISNNITESKSKESLKMYYIFGGFCLCSLIFFGVSYLMWYLDNSNVNNVVSNVIAETTTKHNLVSKDIYTSSDVIEDIQVGQVYDFLEVDFEPLVKRNSDVHAYLKVKGVEGIEYPVMQTMDNEYYLDKDIDRNKSGAGWLFADCRNNLDIMQFNTIIYGHNRVDGLMFGKLKQLLKSEVNSTPDADKIYFNTKTSKMIFEICSIYVTTYDDWEYYDVDFSEKGKENFIERLNRLNEVPVFSRSDLSTMDTFLTLSTCHGGAGTEKRLVVHARLVAIN